MKSINFDVNTLSVRKLFICFLILANSSTQAAEKSDSIYFNTNLEKVQNRSAAIAYVLMDSTDNKEVINLYYIDFPAVYGVFRGNEDVLTGDFTIFHKNGTKSQVGALKKGRFIGEHEFYDISGAFERGEIYHYRKGLVGQYYFSESGKKIYSIADRLSTFGKKRNEIKALKELGKFVNANLEKPEIANDYADPKVLLSFLIAPDGSLEEIHIAEGLHPELDSAAIQVVRSMPKWRPAKFSGQKVYSEFSLSIRF